MTQQTQEFENTELTQHQLHTEWLQQEGLEDSTAAQILVALIEGISELFAKPGTKILNFFEKHLNLTALHQLIKNQTSVED